MHCIVFANKGDEKQINALVSSLALYASMGWWMIAALVLVGSAT